MMSLRLYSLSGLMPALLLVGSLLSLPALGDSNSARLAMEDSSNPMLVLNTSRGDIYLEMLTREAPQNVNRFMALATGEVEFVDAATATSYRPHYFDGMRFHRVLPGFLIQAGSPVYHSLGAPAELLADEINADALGLDQVKVLNPDGTFNAMLDITSKEDFDAQILRPLYQSLNINTVAALESRQVEVLQLLQQMTVKRAYENQGYRFSSRNPSRPVTRGVVALANQGPNSNGPEFFISLADAPTLTGKYTVIGRVVEGMEIVDTIGSTAIDPMQFSRQSTVIYSVTRVE